VGLAEHAVHGRRRVGKQDIWAKLKEDVGKHLLLFDKILLDEILDALEEKLPDFRKVRPDHPCAFSTGSGEPINVLLRENKVRSHEKSNWVITHLISIEKLGVVLCFYQPVLQSL
jgi:hypothetical protein